MNLVGVRRPPPSTTARRFARVDYTGQDAAFLHLNLGTTTSSNISERTLADGTAEDTVDLLTHNAFAWANDFDGITNPVVFGYLPSQLAANPALGPPLADSTLHVVFRIPQPGAPLPDIVAPMASGLPPGYEIVSLSLHATATGTTPTGQQATLVISQNGVLERTPKPIGDAGFTAEVIDVHVHGNSSAALARLTAKRATAVAPVLVPRELASHARVIFAARGHDHGRHSGLGPEIGDRE
jgi:hypothetical protein